MRMQFLGIGCATLAMTLTTFADTWYVDDTGPGGGGTGWGSAKTSLNDVLLNFATNGDTILISRDSHYFHNANVNTSGASETVVDIDDLLTVIGTWGPCPDNSGLPESTPQSVQDCMDKCEDAGLAGQEWADCVDECVQALCAAGIIFCD